jgi:hypothetical protein
MSQSRKQIDHLFEDAPLPPPGLVALEFSNVLGAWLGPKKMREVVQLNAQEDNPNICHSHDFCDANMAMDEAMKKLGVEPMIPTDEEGMPQEICDLWNRAWAMAKANKFYIDGAEVPHK